MAESGRVPVSGARPEPGRPEEEAGGAHWLEVEIELQKGTLGLAVKWTPSADIVAVVGPSGSGKTSLLRVIAGLEREGRGRVAFRGELWQGREGGLFRYPWERSVGWVPQQHLLFPHLDVRGNLGFGGGDERAVARIADLLEIDPLLDRTVAKLSGGEAQRVALGRALLHDPDLLLLDEPFSALDRPLRRRIADRVFEWVGARGVPVVLVSHDESDVARHAGEVWEMSGGSIRSAD